MALETVRGSCPAPPWPCATGGGSLGPAPQLSEAPAAGQGGGETGNAGRLIHRFCHQIMAAPCEILISHTDASFAGHAAQAAFDAMIRLESLWSRFVEHSDVGRINQAAGRDAVIVMPETVDILTLARELHRETHGAFDITAGSRPEVRGMDARAAALRLDSAEMKAHLREEGWRLDPGALGKGLALDFAARVLREDWDLTAALLSAGGSTILALDPPAGAAGWMARIHQQGEAPKVLHLTRCAMSASGMAVKGAHIFDPRRGCAAGAPVERAWAIAPTGGQADALSTAFFVLGIEETQLVLDRHPSWAARLRASETTWHSANWPAELNHPAEV
jgi:FAD:protein FMN transferase